MVRAMVSIAARHGYRAATVSRVTERAEVSRATFYSRFRDREHCFEQAYRYAWRLASSGLLAAPLSAPGRGDLRAVLGRMVALASARPDIAAFLLIAAPGGPAPVRHDYWQRIGELDRLVDRRLTPLQGDPGPHLPASLLTHAFGGIITDYALEGDGARLGALANPAMAWLDSYSDPPARLSELDWYELGGGTSPRPAAEHAPESPGRLPRGSSALDPDSASRLHRLRILDATVQVASSEGYDALTVDRIVATARVSRRAFYQCFEDKFEAFAAAQQIVLRGAIAEAAENASSASSWPEAVWVVGEGLLSYLSRNPDQARLAYLEQFAMGPSALRGSREARHAFAIFLERGYLEFPETAGDREFTTEAIGASIGALIRRHLLHRSAADLPSLVPLGAYVILTPFLGPQAALEFVENRASVASSRASSPAQG